MKKSLLFLSLLSLVVVANGCVFYGMEDQIQPLKEVENGGAKKAFKPSVGELVSLNDSRFDDDKGDMGLWRFAEFTEEVGGGLYFLEPYDPKKIPVLFIHGYTATPRDFENMLTTLDRCKFQPWFAYYPSAMRLDMVAEHFTDALIELRKKYKFKKMYMVGYSMGGLIGRSILLKNEEKHQKNYVSIFVSLAVPWNGHYLADLRTLAPTEAPSWQDIAVGSDFLNSLFMRRLPKGTKYYLLFGYNGDRNPLRPNNDGFITLSSALDRRAQMEAVNVWGFDVGHEEIVDSQDVARMVNSILTEGMKGR